MNEDQKKQMAERVRLAKASLESKREKPGCLLDDEAVDQTPTPSHMYGDDDTKLMSDQNVDRAKKAGQLVAIAGLGLIEKTKEAALAAKAKAEQMKIEWEAKKAEEERLGKIEEERKRVEALAMEELAQAQMQKQAKINSEQKDIDARLLAEGVLTNEAQLVNIKDLENDQVSTRLVRASFVDLSSPVITTDGEIMDVENVDLQSDLSNSDDVKIPAVPLLTVFEAEPRNYENSSGLVQLLDPSPISEVIHKSTKALNRGWVVGGIALSVLLLAGLAYRFIPNSAVPVVLVSPVITPTATPTKPTAVRVPQPIESVAQVNRPPIAQEPSTRPDESPMVEIAIRLPKEPDPVPIAASPAEMIASPTQKKPKARPAVVRAPSPVESMSDDEWHEKAMRDIDAFEKQLGE